MERLEVFDSNKARVRYIIKQRCEAGEPGIGVWHLFDSLANTGSLPYYWMPLRNPPNDEYSGIVADDERVVCIPYEVRSFPILIKVEVLMKSSATSALH
jgi:hypothetical protein